MNALIEKALYRHEALRTIAVMLSVAIFVLSVGLFASLNLQLNPGPENIVSIPVNSVTLPHPGYYLVTSSSTKSGNDSSVIVSVLANAYSNNIVQISSGELVINYDNSKLELISVGRQSNYLYVNESIDNNTGVVTFDFTTVGDRTLGESELIATLEFNRTGNITAPVLVEVDSDNSTLGLTNIAQYYDPIYVSQKDTSATGTYQLQSVQSGIVEMELLSSISLPSGNIYPPGSCTYYLSDWSSCNSAGEQTRYVTSDSTCEPELLAYYQPDYFSRSCSYVMQPNATLRVNSIDSVIQNEIDFPAAESDGSYTLDVFTGLGNVDYCTLTEVYNYAQAAARKSSVLTIREAQTLTRTINAVDTTGLKNISYQLNCSNHLGSRSRVMTVTYDQSQNAEPGVINLNSDSNGSSINVPDSYDLTWEIGGYQTCYLDTSLKYIFGGVLPYVNSNITNPQQLSLTGDGSEVEVGRITVSVDELSSNGRVSYEHTVRCERQDGGFDYSEGVVVQLSPEFEPDLSINVYETGYREQNIGSYPSSLRYQIRWNTSNMNNCRVDVDPQLVSNTSGARIEVLGEETFNVTNSGVTELSFLDINGDWMVYNTLTCSRDVNGTSYTATDTKKFLITSVNYQGENPASYPGEDPISYPGEVPPETCSSEYEPVCGSNGLTYFNQCLATQAGVPIAYQGQCDEDKICTSVESRDCESGSCVSGENDLLCGGECVPLPACAYEDSPCAVDPYTDWCLPIEEEDPELGESDIACPADIDDNDFLNIVDFGAFALNYKQPLNSCSLDIIGDDCLLNLPDFQIFGKYYEQSLTCY